MTSFLRRILFVYLSPYRKKGFLLFVCILTVIAFDTLFPLGTKFLIDYAITPQNARMFVLLVAGLAGLYLISSAGSLGLDYLKAWLVTRVLCDMRLKMFAHLQTLPAGYYAKIDTGDVMTRFTSDLAVIENVLTNSLIVGVLSVLELFTSIVVLFLLDVRLGALTVLTLPLSVALPRRLVRRAARLASQRRAEEAILTGSVQENLQAQAVNRMFGLRDNSIAAFSQQVDRFAGISTRSAFAGWIVNRTTDLG